MGTTEISTQTSERRSRSTQTKRVVFTMGGKGGTGKTGCMLALAEWFEAN